jgi:hypothetical protein
MMRDEMTGVWTQLDEPPAPDPGGAPVTLIEGSSFVISGRSGDIRPDQPEGVFFLDTRLLSDWQLRIDGLRPEPLAVASEGPHAAAFVSRVRPDIPDGTATLLIVRRRYVGRGMREDLSIRNYGRSPVDAVAKLFCDVDFADLFEVKRGQLGSTRERTRATRARFVEYRNQRGAIGRSVRLTFSERPGWETDSASWQAWRAPPTHLWPPADRRLRYKQFRD